jgi:hypothetical protein
MKVFNNIFLALLVTVFACAACSKSEDQKGPMEKAGRAVDEAVDKAKEKTGQVMEKAGEAMKEAGEKIRESGEKAKK